MPVQQRRDNDYHRTKLAQGSLGRVRDRRDLFTTLGNEPATGREVGCDTDGDVDDQHVEGGRYQQRTDHRSRNRRSGSLTSSATAATLITPA